jgi:phage shock protein A
LAAEQGNKDMSSKKPGLFSRMRRAISGTLSDAVDSVSDPGQELALMLDDLAAQLKQAEKDLRQALVDKKVMERKIEELAAKEAEWEERAMQALKLDDEQLARAALDRRSEATQQRKEAEAALAEQTNLVETMKEHIETSKAKLKTLNLRRGSLMAQARAVKKGAGVGSLATDGVSNRMDDIEDKIAHIEAMNEAAAETVEEEAEARAMDEKLAKLEGDTEVDDALAELKAKLKAQGALPEAKEED